MTRDPRVDPRPGDVVAFVAAAVATTKLGGHVGERRSQYHETVASVVDGDVLTARGAVYTLAAWREHCLRASVAVPGSALDEVRRLTRVWPEDDVVWQVDALPGDTGDGYGGATAATIRRVYDVALGQDIPVTPDVVEVVRLALRRTFGWGM